MTRRWVERGLSAVKRDAARRHLPAALAAALAVTAPLSDAEALEPAASRERQLERVQMHRNGARGVAYLPRSEPDDDREPDRIELRARSVIRLTGDADENVRGGLYPIDVDGDGTFEFLHFNGYRLMRVVRESGDRLWEDRNPNGRRHRSYTHRDTLAVLDLDGEPGQEIVHCWLNGNGGKELVVRSGATGRVLRSTALSGDNPGDECQIAAFRMTGSDAPVIMVSRGGNLAGSGCARPWIDLWPVTAAFGPDLRRLWQRTTCDAGHYAWPLDEDGDGRAEGVFVGRYLLRSDGTLACTLPNWGGDHVDSMVVADLDPAGDGFEVFAVGRSGSRTYRARDCDLRAEQPGSLLDDPQHVNAAVFDPDSGVPSLVVRSRASARAGREQVHLISLLGRILGDIREPDARHLRPMQNASLDGARAAEELVTSFGQVIDREGRVRLDTDWYWDLDGGSGSGNLPYRRWTSAPVVVDLDGDGQDEIVTWGRERIVVGGRRTAEDDDDDNGDDDNGDDGSGDDGSGDDGEDPDDSLDQDDDSQGSIDDDGIADDDAATDDGSTSGGETRVPGDVTGSDGDRGPFNHRSRRGSHNDRG